MAHIRQRHTLKVNTCLRACRANHLALNSIHAALKFFKFPPSFVLSDPHRPTVELNEKPEPTHEGGYQAGTTRVSSSSAHNPSRWEQQQEQTTWNFCRSSQVEPSPSMEALTAHYTHMERGKSKVKRREARCWRGNGKGRESRVRRLFWATAHPPAVSG